MEYKCGWLKAQTSGMSGQMSACKVILGFVPDVFEIRVLNDNSGLRSYWWGKTIHDAGLVGKFGIGEFNHTTNEDDAGYGNTHRRSAIVLQLDGISALDEDYVGAMIESPIAGVGKKPMHVAVWESATAYYNTRDKGQIGDIVKPKMYLSGTSNTGLVYECVSNSAADSLSDGTNEPLWPKSPGKSVIDDSAIWVARTAEYKPAGGKGVIIGHSLLQENALSTTAIQFRAIQADVNKVVGEAPATGEMYFGNV